MATTPSSAPDLLDPVARRARVEADLTAMPGLRAMLEEIRLYPSLDAELDRCVPPLYVSPVPNREARRRHGIYFDPAEVARFLIFTRKLRHVKGKFGGAPLVPDLWQVVYALAPVFGWRQADGNRYFRELFFEVPRKNGKSTISSAIALYLLMADSNLKAGRLYEPGAEVYAAATTTDQARAVFRPAEAMARRSPALSRRLGIVKDRALVYDRTISRFEVISGDPAKAEEKMGGNVSGAVIDETHVHRDRRLIDTIETGTPGREQPLVCHLTTAGADTDGTIYAEKHDLAIAIAEGKVTDVRTWAVIYTIPDELADRWDDREVWQVANPGLGISVSIDYLENEAAKALRSEPKRLAFCRLHLNRRTATVSRWVDLEVYDRAAAHAVPTWAQHRSRPAYGGLDLSNSLDLSAAAWLVPRWIPDPTDPDFEIEVLDVVLRCWTPAGRLKARPPKERELFARWIRDGYLKATPGDVIDYDRIEDELFADADHLEVERLSFDRWGSKMLEQHLRDGGLTMLPVGQGFAGISPAMKETERLIYEGRLRTGGNPLLRYAFENLAVELDASGNVKPNRKRSTGHVDPAVAVVMAVESYSRETYGTSVYEDRGLATA